MKKFTEALNEFLESEENRKRMEDLSVQQLAKEINKVANHLNNLIYQGLITERLLIVTGEDTLQECELVAEGRIQPYYIRVQAAIKP